MEETTVVIVGAGPSGLALAVYLGRMNVKAIILEKELEVTEDPRAIAIAGDAVRISYQMGIGDVLVKDIGDATGTLYFHNRNFQRAPFMSFDTTKDYLLQSVSNAINQFQPNYERALRVELSCLSSCNLRTGCEVVNMAEEDGSVVVEYVDTEGNRRDIRTSWFIGADGKRGVVRKKFLEPEGIIQQVGLYEYVSTWIAGNLSIELPTQTTHPDFPLWKLGYSPNEVYELFWPAGFHFCNDTKRPAVSGRFGPKGAHFWRHEYSVEPEDSLDDPEEHLWAQFGPWLEIQGSRISSKLKGMTITYPRDCVKILRCRPFSFAAQVVNRWFCRRTILIGDAAHVFPPFGGQGIAAGIRDAQALAWRLAILSRLKLTPSLREGFLMEWAGERRQAIDHATRMTKVNGVITNQRSAAKAFLLRCLMRFLWCMPAAVKFITRSTLGDTFRYQDCHGSFALGQRGGGWKLPQIWIQKGEDKPELSDAVFIRDLSRLALIYIVRGYEEVEEKALAECIQKMAFPGEVFTKQNVTFLHIDNEIPDPNKTAVFQEHYHTCGAKHLLMHGIKPINGYDEKSLERRVGKRAKYVIMRPDFFIHSVASNEEELLENAGQIARCFGQDAGK
ncbi:FAD/NAD(P)-binding domain-containing protein [Acephala macrosclerotiorum]|nr:FAD/NAD(P)-binding domain-containing protein [Acephala macrosclerotiorum]